MKALKLLLASTFVLCGTQAFADTTTTTTIEQQAPVVHETEHVKEVEQVPVPVEVPAPESHSSYSSSSSSSKIIKKSEAPESSRTTTTRRRVAYRAPRRTSCAKTTCSKSVSKPAQTEMIEQHESHTESNSSDNQ